VCRDPTSSIYKQVILHMPKVIANKAAYTGRQSMRDRGTYYVVREAHKVETDQQVCLLPLKRMSADG
jgi:hypothetical protein